MIRLRGIQRHYRIGGELVRAWYGRMVVIRPLAPAQLPLAPSPLAVGCSGGRHARELAPEACAEPRVTEKPLRAA